MSRVTEPGTAVRSVAEDGGALPRHRRFCRPRPTCEVSDEIVGGDARVGVGLDMAQGVTVAGYILAPISSMVSSCVRNSAPESPSEPTAGAYAA